MEDFNLSKKLSIRATGRRKTAVAQVQLIEGKGQFSINGKDSLYYLQKNVNFISCLKAPFELLKLEPNYDLIIKVKGGGFLGQVEAIQLGISRALCALKEVEGGLFKEGGFLHRNVLKKQGFLRRDSRSKERKKYGLKKARKAAQYSKR